MRTGAWCAALVLLAGAAAAQTTPVLTVSGRVAHPAALSPNDLAKLPAAAQDHASGVLLWTVLDRAGWTDLPGRKTHLQHVVLARGRDGYAVALSIAELDPAFEGKPVLVATMRDGKDLPAYELMVPGDHRAGRHVKDLVAVEVQ